MKPVRFHPLADDEMVEAARWYEEQQAGLGRRFLVAVQETVQRVQAAPMLYSVAEANVRRCLVRTFPFAVLFRIETEHLLILAVMHSHRDPGYWRQRTEE